MKRNSKKSKQSSNKSLSAPEMRLKHFKEGKLHLGMASIYSSIPAVKKCVDVYHDANTAAQLALVECESVVKTIMKDHFSNASMSIALNHDSIAWRRFSKDSIKSKEDVKKMRVLDSDFLILSNMIEMFFKSVKDIDSERAESFALDLTKATHDSYKKIILNNENIDE